jgi:tape measure domain-containing protein
MSANLGTAWIQVKPSMDGVRGSILSGLKGTGSDFGNQMGSEVQKSTGMNAGMAAIWGAASAVAFKAIDAIGSKLQASLDGAIRRVDTLNNSNRTFANMGFDAAASATAVDLLEKSIRGLPTPLDSALRGMTALAATYSDVGLGQKVFTALNDAILGFGGTADQVDNAIMQLSQLPMDGPLDAQTWNSLRNSGITPVLVAMAKESGVSVGTLKENFGSGQLKVQDFVNELIKMDQVGGGGLVSLANIARDSTKGIATSMTNAQTATSRGIAAIITALGTTGIADAISKSGTAMETALKSIASVIKFVQDNADFAKASVIGLATAFTAILIPAALKAIPPINLLGTYIGLFGLKLQAVAKFAFIPTLIGAIAAGIAFFVISAGGVGPAGDKLVGIFDQVTTFAQGLIAQLPSLITALSGFFTTQLPQIFTGLIGAIVQAAPVVWNGIKALVDGIITTLYSQGPSLISTFVTLLGNVVDFITSNIGRFATIGTTIIVQLLNSLTAALPSLITAGVQIINDLVNSIVAALPAIIQAGVNIINFLVTAIVDNLPKIIASAVLILTALIAGIISVLPSLIDAALQIILALANALLDNLPQIITAAIGLVMALVTAILNNLPAIIKAAVTLITSLVTGLIGALPQLITAAVALISGLAGGLIANLPLIITAAVTLVIALVGALIQAIPMLIGAAFQLIFALIGAIIQLVPAIIGAAIQLIVALVGGLIGGIGQLLVGAGKIGLALLQALGQISLVNIGMDLIKGLWNGISNMAGWIGDKIKGFGDGIVKGLKDFFGIHSPSHLMRDEIGEMIGRGTGVGIANSTKYAVKAAVQQSQAVMDAFSSMAGPTLGFSANSDLVAAGAGAGFQQFNITNPDPNQTAAIVASRIKQNGGI